MIDWDFAAHGIWLVQSPEELARPRPRGLTFSRSAEPRDRPRGWSDRLSEELLGALDAWNAWGETLIGLDGGDPGRELDAFFARAAELAQRTQQELGPDYEVSYISPVGEQQVRSPHD